MTNRIDLQVRVRHTVGKGRFGIQPIQAQQLHITESSKKINLKLNSRYLTTSVRLKDDSRPFFLSDSFQSVVHYYVSVDGMRQQEGPLKIMKSIKYGPVGSTILGQDHPGTWNLDNQTCAKVTVSIGVSNKRRANR